MPFRLFDHKFLAKSLAKLISDIKDNDAVVAADKINITNLTLGATKVLKQNFNGFMPRVGIS